MNMPSDQELLVSSATALHSFLESHTDAEHRVREILEKYLKRIDKNTYSKLFTSLALYLGQDAINIFDYVSQTDQFNRLEDLKKISTPETINFLCILISLYGIELAEVYKLSNPRPDDWLTFFRDVNYDEVNKVYNIRIRLEKYNGEEPVIEGESNSMIDLATNMIRTLTYVSDRDVFLPELAQQFIDEANGFVAFLQPPSPEEPDSKPKHSKTSSKSDKPN